jgi:transcriptional regulator GlxA family with amidase domain
MKRRDFLGNGAALGIVVAAATVPGIMGGSFMNSDDKSIKGVPANKLTPPATGAIPVAFAISEGATVIDFCGPWEVFQDVTRPHGNGSAFDLYTVSERTEPLLGSAGLKLVPDYTFENAPAPKVVVIPAQSGSTALHAWLRQVTPSTDVTMSVCTGAFQLAKAGLLSGKSATTHHEFLDRLEKNYPDITVKRGLRFVEGEKISTAGGLTSGIDLALRVVERYFGREVATTTAFYMEYQSKSWIV